MFAIASQQNQYKTYILSDEAADAHLEVVPERGGIITQWRVQGKEILYLDAERFANPNLSIRGGIPILFPICGNLPNNTYTHNGQSYTLKQHGFARDLPWEVTEQSTDGKARITLTLNSNDQTRAVYPFDFQLSFTYSLQGKNLQIDQSFTNRSNEPMPFSTGLHPYFATSDKSQLEFEIPSSEFQDQIAKTFHPFEGKFDFNQEEIDVAFPQVNGQEATVTDKSCSLQLKLSWNDACYSTPLVFWTIKGKDFYCLEPWSAPRNALNTGVNLLHLEPAATFSTWVNLSIVV